MTLADQLGCLHQRGAATRRDRGNQEQGAAELRESDLNQASKRGEGEMNSTGSQYDGRCVAVERNLGGCSIFFVPRKPGRKRVARRKIKQEEKKRLGDVRSSEGVVNRRGRGWGLGVGMEW